MLLGMEDASQLAIGAVSGASLVKVIEVLARALARKSSAPASAFNGFDHKLRDVYQAQLMKGIEDNARVQARIAEELLAMASNHERLLDNLHQLHESNRRIELKLDGMACRS